MNILRVSANTSPLQCPSLASPPVQNPQYSFPCSSRESFLQYSPQRDLEIYCSVSTSQPHHQVCNLEGFTEVYSILYASSQRPEI